MTARLQQPSEGVHCLRTLVTLVQPSSTQYQLDACALIQWFIKQSIDGIPYFISSVRTIGGAMYSMQLVGLRSPSCTLHNL